MPDESKPNAQQIEHWNDTAGPNWIRLQATWYEDRGEHELKGIPEPQRLFAVLRQAQDEEPS